MVDLYWVGNANDKLFIQDGGFTATNKASLSVGSVEAQPSGISWDGTNTSWCGYADDKLYLQSGTDTTTWSSTIKDSIAIAAVEQASLGVGWNGVHTLIAGDQANKLYIVSGQFETTQKDSQDIGSLDGNPSGVESDDTYPIWTGRGSDKLWRQSGSTTTVELTYKLSQTINAVDINPLGISFDATNWIWCGIAGPKLYQQSGQTSVTTKNSQDTTTWDTSPYGVSWGDADARLGIAGGSIIPQVMHLRKQMGMS